MWEVFVCDLLISLSDCLWSKWSPSCISFFALCLPSCVEVRELKLCTPYLYLKFLSGGPFVENPIVDSWNPSVWRRGRSAVARISKYILVFTFGSFSQLSTLHILYCYYYSFIYMLDIVCTPTLWSIKRAIEAPQLLT